MVPLPAATGFLFEEAEYVSAFRGALPNIFCLGSSVGATRLGWICLETQLIPIRPSVLGGPSDESVFWESSFYTHCACP